MRNTSYVHVVRNSLHNYLISDNKIRYMYIGNTQVQAESTLKLNDRITTLSIVK